MPITKTRSNRRRSVLFILALLAFLIIALASDAGHRRSPSGSFIMPDISSHAGGGRVTDARGNVITSAASEAVAGISTAPSGSRITHTGLIQLPVEATAFQLR